MTVEGPLRGGDPERLPADVDEFLRAIPAWTFAKTMPTIPHEYVVRGARSSPPAAWHDWMVALIRERGYQRKFFGRTYTYLEHDGFKYWVVGEVINREPLKGEGDAGSQT